MVGVPFEDCGRVAEVNGIKIVLNDFVAFSKLGENYGFCTAHACYKLHINFHVHI